MNKRIFSIIAILVILALVVSACGGGATTPAPAQPKATEKPAEKPAEKPVEKPAEKPAAPASNIKELKIIWAEWDPANYLAELVKDYEKDAGVKVTVIQEPWGSYYTRVSADWAAKACPYEMLVGDSQWTGQGATQGHYVELTKFLQDSGLGASVTPGTLKYYGEFPKDSKKYWGFPTEGDADGFAYRKDLFEDPKEMAAFKAKYGYDLAVPKTWKELLDISEFFYRPNATPPLYGAAVYTQKDYDALTMGFENVMFSYGVDWQDANNNVMGVINSPKAVEALDFYKKLYKFGPPGNNNSFFAEMNNYFTSGQVVMAMNYFAFFPALANEKTNPYAKVTGYFANPAGPYGDRYAALGGQGLNINAHCSPEQQQASFDFIKWFGQEKVQAKWAQLGGYTCNKNVLASPEFLKVAPFNAAFAETMNMVKDFWNIPEFGELLAPVQQYLHGFVVGDQGTAQEAMDNIAKEHDKILKAAGYIKEGAAAPAPAPVSNIKELKIIWAEWDPANYLAELVKDYEKDAGVKVTIIQEPWGSYYTRVSADWAAKACPYEMLVGDSQWTGQGATQGHYVELTKFLQDSGLGASVTPGTLKYYGEFPKDSKKYWGFPTEGDADGFAYRKDLFEDPKEMAAFKAKYGYDLAVPKTWKELLDISEFFYRPNATPPLYGAAVYTQKDYDALTMGFENVMFSYGVDWQDANNNVMGVINSDKAVAALELYKKLYKFGPPGNNNSFFAEMNNYFTSGQVVMAMNYFAFFPALANEKTNPYAKVTGYFANPAGPDGQRYAALGGQGLNINAHCSPEQQQASFDFIKWFGQEKVQAKWAALGGYTCNTNVLASPEFLKVAPFNAAFAETMNMVKDFWNIPEFGELLAPVQQYLHGFVVGDQGTAQEAMDNIAKEHDKILKDAGYIK